MKRKRLVVVFIILIAGLFLAIPVWAHTPLLGVEDNEDGTIYIEGGFSDGSSGAGVTILIVEDKVFKRNTKSRDRYIALLKETETLMDIAYEGDTEDIDIYEGKLVLLRTKLDEFGELTLDKPDVPYIIVFDAGPGHVVKREGPTLTDEEKKIREEDKR